MSRCPALAAVALAFVVPAGCTGRTATGPARIVAPCSWSLFGDARSVAHRGHVFTGCIGIDGTTLVEDLELDTGRRRLDAVFRPLEVDDHNNPGLAIFAGDLYAFSAPHSGYAFPRDRRSRMRYRVLRGGKWGAIRRVPLGKGCGLGYTYPNPVVAGERLYLFMRGPCWTPYFTSTADGRHWTRPRSLVRSPSPSLQDGGGTRRVRPYAKYAGTSGGSILIALSDGHPASFRSSLYFVRFKDGRFLAADGRVIGTPADLPLRFAQLDRVAPYAAAVGRAWPLDIAPGRERDAGRRVLVARRRERHVLLRPLGRAALAHAADRERGPVAVHLPQLRHHARPLGPVVGRAQPHDRRAERDRGASHAGPRHQLVPGRAHAQVELVQHPARDPARPERSAQAGSALRRGLGPELPRVRHGGRDGVCRARDSSPRYR
jgi:hypothetical protein